MGQMRSQTCPPRPAEIQIAAAAGHLIRRETPVGAGARRQVHQPVSPRRAERHNHRGRVGRRVIHAGVEGKPVQVLVEAEGEGDKELSLALRDRYLRRCAAIRRRIQQRPQSLAVPAPTGKQVELVSAASAPQTPYPQAEW